MAVTELSSACNCTSHHRFLKGCNLTEIASWSVGSKLAIMIISKIPYIYGVMIYP